MTRFASTAIVAVAGILCSVFRGDSVAGLGGRHHDPERPGISPHTQQSGRRLRGGGDGDLGRWGHEDQWGGSRPRGGSGDAWNRPSRRRISFDDSHQDRVLCNSIGCPVHHVPIENASYVECDGGKCNEDMCCQAMCSSFPCHDGYNAIPEADKVECDKEHSSNEQCCEKDSGDCQHEIVKHESEDEDKSWHEQKTCSDFACSSDSIPVVDSQTLKCNDGTCDQHQCCVEIEKVPAESRLKWGSRKPRKHTPTPTCYGYTCPNGYTPHSDFDATKCFDGKCDTDQCCMKWTPHHSNPAVEAPASTSAAAMIVMCFDYTCPNGYVPHSDYDTTECFEGGCDVEQCCMESVETPAAATRLMCSEYTCPEGYAPHAEYYTTDCFDGVCDVQQCCVNDDSDSALGAVVYSTRGPSSSLHHKHQYHHDSCSTYQCPPKHVLLDNANSIGCRHSVAHQSTTPFPTMHYPSIYIESGHQSSYRDEQYLRSSASNVTLEHTGGNVDWSDAEPTDLGVKEEVGVWGGVSVEGMVVWEEGVIERRLSVPSRSGGGVASDELLCNPSTCCQKIDSEERQTPHPVGALTALGQLKSSV